MNNYWVYDKEDIREFDNISKCLSSINHSLEVLDIKDMRGCLKPLEGYLNSLRKIHNLIDELDSKGITNIDRSIIWDGMTNRSDVCGQEYGHDKLIDHINSLILLAENSKDGIREYLRLGLYGFPNTPIEVKKWLRKYVEKGFSKKFLKLNKISYDDAYIFGLLKPYYYLVHKESDNTCWVITRYDFNKAKPKRLK